MDNAHLLIVEDEAPIRDMVRFALERSGYLVNEAENAPEARIMLAEQRPDLILMDWMLPGVSGVELVRQLRSDEHTRDIPVIMLTARGEEEDKIRGLEVGADDYVTKPFSPKELVARIKAVLRRVTPLNGKDTIEINKLRLEPETHRVFTNDKTLTMGPTEFRLLYFFMTHPERVYSRGQLLDRIWGNNVYIEERTVDVHIGRLRKVLSPYGHDQYIQTVRGAGYRFSAQG
jgi:two-component system phosphate regulon response regulator PhoB